MKFLVKYFEITKQSEEKIFLGQECLTDIDEYLIYNFCEGKKIFLNKKFSSSNCYRWELLNIEDSEVLNFDRVLIITLVNKFDRNEEFLTQTLKKNRKAGHGGIRQLLYKGKIVEVEYGHPFQIYKVNKKIATNKRYSSTLQSSEMHKRRLAIVVKIHPNGQVQVVPITSKAQCQSDKSCFILEKETLEKTVYFSEEITSWVLCSMIQSVSQTRILPVEIQTRYRKKRSYPRDNKYLLKLSRKDLDNLDSSLIHAVNLSDYQKRNQESLDKANKLNEELNEKLNQANKELTNFIKIVQDNEKYKKFCEKEGINPDEYT